MNTTAQVLIIGSLGWGLAACGARDEENVEADLLAIVAEIDDEGDDVGAGFVDEGPLRPVPEDLAMLSEIAYAFTKLPTGEDDAKAERFHEDLLTAAIGVGPSPAEYVTWSARDQRWEPSDALIEQDRDLSQADGAAPYDAEWGEFGLNRAWDYSSCDAQLVEVDGDDGEEVLVSCRIGMVCNGEYRVYVLNRHARGEDLVIAQTAAQDVVARDLDGDGTAELMLFQYALPDAPQALSILAWNGLTLAPVTEDEHLPIGCGVGAVDVDQDGVDEAIASAGLCADGACEPIYHVYRMENGRYQRDASLDARATARGDELRRRLVFVDEEGCLDPQRFEDQP